MNKFGPEIVLNGYDEVMWCELPRFCWFRVPFLKKIKKFVVSLFPFLILGKGIIDYAECSPTSMLSHLLTKRFNPLCRDFWHPLACEPICWTTKTKLDCVVMSMKHSCEHCLSLDKESSWSPTCWFRWSRVILKCLIKDTRRPDQIEIHEIIIIEFWIRSLSWVVPSHTARNLALPWTKNAFAEVCCFKFTRDTDLKGTKEGTEPLCPSKRRDSNWIKLINLSAYIESPFDGIQRCGKVANDSSCILPITLVSFSGKRWQKQSWNKKVLRMLICYSACQDVGTCPCRPWTHWINGRKLYSLHGCLA
jgi:hypothetical protein